MGLGKKHSIKSRVIAFMALVISLCYVLGPIPLKLGDVFHVISHELEAPKNILQHNFDVHNTPQEKDKEAIKYDKTIAHQHEILEILDTVFNGETSKDPVNKSNYLELKIDKHFFSARYTIPQKYSSRSPYIFTKKTLKVQRGYPDMPLKPPAT